MALHRSTSLFLIVLASFASSKDFAIKTNDQTSNKGPTGSRLQDFNKNLFWEEPAEGII
jgi:hypothetical protein